MFQVCARRLAIISPSVERSQRAAKEAFTHNNRIVKCLSTSSPLTTDVNDGSRTRTKQPGRTATPVVIDASPSTPRSENSSAAAPTNPPRTSSATSRPDATQLSKTLSTSLKSRSSNPSQPTASDGFDYHSSVLNPENRRTTADVQPPYHLHVFSTRHNTHMTLTKPDRNPIISVSAGNIGFRKAARKSYDAAYQLAAFVMSTIQNRGLLLEIHSLEVIFRGFGIGREAVSKALMGMEGRNIRSRIIRVSDSTRLKFGGTRSPKPRRLG